MRRVWLLICLSASFLILGACLMFGSEPRSFAAREQNVGVLTYERDTPRTVIFRNPSYLLPLTVMPPPMTGCACVRVVTLATTIPPRHSATFIVVIEAASVGERMEALRFTARQGFRTRPVYVFMIYRVLPARVARGR